MPQDRRRRDDLRLNAGINVTSLVDVAFTLLVFARVLQVTAVVAQTAEESGFTFAWVDEPWQRD